MQTTTADVPDSAKSEPLAQPDLEYQNQYAGTFAQSDSQQQPTEMIDKEERASQGLSPPDTWRC
jgi:hypothetical protein